MIARGGGSGELRRGMITIKHGLGLAGSDIFIDTHFGERGRFPRNAKGPLATAARLVLKELHP